LDLAFRPQARGWLTKLFGIWGWLSGLARSSFLSALALKVWAGFLAQPCWFRGWLSFFALRASSRGWLSGLAGLALVWGCAWPAPLSFAARGWLASWTAFRALYAGLLGQLSGPCVGPRFPAPSSGLAFETLRLSGLAFGARAFELSFGARSQSLGWVLGPGLLVSGLVLFLHARGQLSGLALGAGWLGTCLGLRLAYSAFFRGLTLASQLDCRQGFQCWPAGPALGAVCWTSLSGPKLGAGFRDSSAFGAGFRSSRVRAFFRRSLLKPGLGSRPRLAGFGAGFLSSRSGPALGAGSRGWLSGLAGLALEAG
jgi:hypothetical protein